MIVIIFCRNPDGDVQPWCYIADHEDGIYWRYCDIPTCQSKRLPLLYLALCLHPFHALRGKSWAYGPTTFIAMLIFSPAMNSFYGLRWLVHSYYHLKNVSNCLPSLLLLPCLGLSSSCHCLLVCVCIFVYIYLHKFPPLALQLVLTCFFDASDYVHLPVCRCFCVFCLHVGVRVSLSSNSGINMCDGLFTQGGLVLLCVFSTSLAHT